MLFSINTKSSAEKYAKYKFIEVKILPKNFNFPIAINIYGDKVAILLSSGDLEPITILIEDKGLSEDFKTYFEILWNISKKLSNNQLKKSRGKKDC